MLFGGSVGDGASLLIYSSLILNLDVNWICFLKWCLLLLVCSHASATVHGVVHHASLPSNSLPILQEWILTLSVVGAISVYHLRWLATHAFNTSIVVLVGLVVHDTPPNNP